MHSRVGFQSESIPWSKKVKLFFPRCRALKMLPMLAILFVVLLSPMHADAALTAEPLTWNIIGLDSNNVSVGPNHFPVGARVCSVGASATNVQATFNWEATPTSIYINLRPGTATTLPVSGTVNLAAGECIDAFYEVEVTRNSLAYEEKRGYYISFTADGGLTASTPRPRELYVEKLVSQARNSVTGMEVSSDGAAFTPVAPGGTMSLIVGNTYWIKILASTATGGYEQIETFINFPNIIFQILSVVTTYTAESSSNMTPPYDKLYGDGCVWENDPNSSNYRACLSTGKAGNEITVTYEVKILSVPSAPLINPEPLSTLTFDFSGSSFHYNSDFGVTPRYGNVIDPTQGITISKNFSPDLIGVNGISALTFTITNTYGSSISDVNFIDTFPTSPAAMTLANTITGNTCGGTLQDSSGGSLDAGDAGIKLINGVLPANGSCSITVNVTVPNNTGTYTNTSNALYIGTTSTGKTATDTLNVTNAPIPPSPPTYCSNPVQLAMWDFNNSTAAATSKAADVTTATASFTSSTGGVAAFATPGAAGSSSVAWGAYTNEDRANPAKDGWAETAASSNNYFQFQVTTNGYNGVYVTFDGVPDVNGDWANPKSTIYFKSSTDGSSYTTYELSPTPTYPTAPKGNWAYGITTAAVTNSSGDTYFRFSVDGASKTAATFYLDNVRVMGCKLPDPPAVQKSFSPSAVAVGSTSTMTLTITNPNWYARQNLTGLTVTDYLPQDAQQGTVAVTNGSATVTGTGSAFKTQLVANSIVSIPQALTGTVSVTNGSAAVTGSSTLFTTELAVGSIITISSVNYTVAAIADNTNLTLSSAYAGSTASGLSITEFQNYTVSSIASDTQLTLTANYTGSTASGLTMLAGLTFDTTSAPATTCGSPITNVTSGGRAITLSGSPLTGTLTLTNGSNSVSGTSTQFTSQVGAGRMMDLPFQLAGTVAVTNASKVVTGTGTSFATQLAVGDPIYIPQTLTGTLSATSGSAAVTGAGTSFTTELAVGDYIQIGTIHYWVAAIAGNTSLTLTSAASTTVSGVAGTVYKRYLVDGITDATTLKLKTAYTGTTGSGKNALGLKEYTITAVGASLTLNTNYTSAATINTAMSPELTNGGLLLGTVAVTNGSATVTGTATRFTKQLAVGNTVLLPSNMTGTVAVTSGSATVTGTGSSFTTELAVGDIITINSISFQVVAIASNTSLTLSDVYPSTTASGLTAQRYNNSYTVSAIASDTSLTLTANYTGTTASDQRALWSTTANTCTITATVKANAAGTRTNITETVSAAESGRNTTSTGFAAADLSALLPPIISMVFVPNTIAAGGTSTATFTITNPNTNNALSGVAFTNVFPTSPGAMTLANTTTSSTCGGSLTDSGGGALGAGDVGIQLSGGLLTAGGSCTITVNVTASTVTGNLTGTVAVTNGSATVTGTGTAFTTQLAVGRTIYIDGVGYEIAAIASDTSMTLTTAYAGPTAGGLTVPSGYFNYNVSGSVAVSALINGSPVYGNMPTDTLMVRAPNPEIAFKKYIGPTATGQWYDTTLAIATGGNVYYQFVVENIGDVPFFPISVTDDLHPAEASACSWANGAGPITAGNPLAVPAAANENHIATCVIGPFTASAGSTTNTASASGTYGGTPYPSGTDTATYKTTQLFLDLSGDQSFAAAGSVLNYSYVVTNTGFASLKGPITLTDNKVGASYTCPAVSSAGDHDDWLEPPYALQGTVQVTNGSPTVTGTGTAFLTQVNVDDYVSIASVYYKVLSVASDTGLTLTANYEGSTTSGLTAYFVEIIICTGTYTATAGDVTAGSVTNTATAHADGVDSNNDSSTAAYKPTLVFLSDFHAVSENGMVRLEWTTTSQTGTAGFYLFRLDGTGNYRQVNRALLPAIPGNRGGTYSLLDRGAVLARGNTYVLLEIERRGRQNAYGPFTVSAGGGNTLQNSYRINNADLLKSLHIGRYVLDEASDYTRKEHEQTAKTKTRLAAAKAAKAKAFSLKKTRKGDQMKIAVVKDGLYYIDAAEIAGLLGMQRSAVIQAIKNRKLAMSNQGSATAYMPADDYSGLFFFGKSIDSTYTKENIYRLYKGQGTFVPHEDGHGPAPSAQETFTETVHAEQDLYYLTTPDFDPESDYWFWSYHFVAPSYTDDASGIFTIQTYGVADVPETATLTVRVKGFTDTDADPDHHVRVSLMDGAVTKASAEGWLGGTNSGTPVLLQFDQRLLTNGDNTIKVEAVSDPGVPYSAFFVDSFDLTYQRLYEAHDNALDFRAESVQPVTIYGFTDPSIVVMDLSDPQNPLLDRATTIQDEGGSFSVSFVPGSPGARYLVAASDAAGTGLTAWRNTLSSLGAKKNMADYLIITTDELMTAAQGLATYRQGQGYKTMVVNLENIMDEFNHGIYSPWAIKDFLTYAHYNWIKPPKYVVLVGEGTYDYKNNKGMGDNLVPTMIVETPDGLFASDNILADADGDHVPDVAIGRLPVLTAEELQNLIAKIRTFETTSGKKVLMLSDNADLGGNFPADSNYISRLVPAKYAVENMSLTDSSVDDTKNKLLSGISANTFLVNYIGHANPFMMAEEGLLLTTDISSMQNPGRLFVMSGMTCLMGDFAIPGFDSLSEELLMKGNGGAAAVWAPSALAFNDHSRVLDEGFYAVALRESNTTLGRSINKAFRYYKSKGMPDYILDVYNLIGDPALKFPVK